MRENCLQQFDAHWECLEKRNQVCISDCRFTSLLFPGFYNGDNHTLFIFQCRDLGLTVPKLLNGVVNNLLIQLVVQTFRNTSNAVNLNES